MSEARGRTRSAKARMPCTSSSSNEELSEVQGNAPVHQVWEDEATRVVLLDADGQLVGETADRLSRRRSEGDVRIILGPQAGLLREVEEGSLVGFGTQPPAPSIPQHSIENHHPFDHPADRPKATVAVVGLANCFVERSMVDVVQPPTSDGPWLDGSRESAVHQSGHELTTVLAANRSSELAVLALQKTSRVDHDGHEELTLSQRQAVLGQSGHSTG
jgi:hypothetical protein